MTVRTKPIRVWAAALMDYMSKSGSPKITSVDTTKKRVAKDYRRGQDYYLGMREAIAKARPDNVDEVMDATIAAALDERRGHYSKVAQAYSAWLNRQRDIRFIRPKRGVWQHGRLSVTVNPELLVEIDGTPHHVVLHYSNSQLDKNAALAGTALMRAALGRLAPHGCVMAILDVRKGVLHTEKRAAKAALWLEAEAASFISAWDALPDYEEQLVGR